MKSSTSNKLSILIVAYIIWPFGALLLSLKNINRSSYIIFILVGIFFGYTFRAADSTSDIVRYVEAFKEVSTWTLSGLINAYASDSYSDYYSITLSFIVSRFSDNSHVFIAFVSLIFSIFYVFSIRIVITKINPKANVLSSVFIFILFFYISIYFIMGMRFFTAFYVFVYSFLQIYYNNNKKYYLLAALTPFMHLAFVPMVGFLILYWFFKRNRKICFTIMIVSFLFQPNIDLARFVSNENAIKKVTAYTTEQGLEGIQSKYERQHVNPSEKYFIYRSIFDSHLLFLSGAFFLMFFNKQARNHFDKYDGTLLNVNLLFLSIANILGNFGEGYRYTFFFGFFLIITFFSLNSLNFNFRSFKTSIILWLYIFGMLVYELSHLYLFSENTSIVFLLTNWFFAPFLL